MINKIISAITFCTNYILSHKGESLSIIGVSTGLFTMIDELMPTIKFIIAILSGISLILSIYINIKKEIIKRKNKKE